VAAGRVWAPAVAAATKMPAEIMHAGRRNRVINSREQRE
jgi:hypothetical protein